MLHAEVALHSILVGDFVIHHQMMSIFKCISDWEWKPTILGLD